MSALGAADYVRTIRMEAARVAPEALEVTGHLVDERPKGGGWFGIPQEPVIHDMRVVLRVRLGDLVVTRVEAEMVSRPYTLCADALEPLQQLVGVSVARGFMRAVNERFGRQAGCAHLTALVQAMGPVVKQGVGALRPESDLPERGEEMWWVDTCQAWREGGLLHQRLVAGDIDGLRALGARGLPPARTGA